MHEPRTPRTIVVGGGLAGLTAAASLARSGWDVTVLEAGEHLGGRARTRQRDGFDLNLGPHALYRAGGGLGALRRLGVRVRGRLPRLDRAGVLIDDQVVPAFRYLRHDVSDRVRVAKALTGLGHREAAAWAGRSADEWLDHVTDDAAGRALLASAVRTATYSADLARTDASAVALQLRLATHGVLYLHHGWSTLVDGLADVVRSAGGQLRTRSTVATVEHDDEQVQAVRLADGHGLDADAVIVAVNEPRRLAGLLQGAPAARLRAIAEETVPVRMAHLDVALRPLPEPRFPNVLGLDVPVYLTIQSSVADVAPRDGAVLHIARYLRPGEEGDDHRPVLEHALDVMQPNWQDHVVDARFVPRSMVSGDLARMATHGVGGRAPTDVTGVRGLVVAGDWVGPKGMLADAAILSGLAAANAVMADTSGVPHREGVRRSPVPA
jgi:phytoene dehydrogenase-like protein